jgi:hypothetical protein
MSKSIQERLKQLENTFRACCNKLFKLIERVEIIETTLEDKADSPIVIEGVSVTTSGWTLVSGLYEKVLTNSNITATSIVYIVPDNSAYNIVQNAEVYPRTESSAGSVKIFAADIPTNTFTVTFNIFN